MYYITFDKQKEQTEKLIEQCYKLHTDCSIREIDCQNNLKNLDEFYGKLTNNVMNDIVYDKTCAEKATQQCNLFINDLISFNDITFNFYPTKEKSAINKILDLNLPYDQLENNILNPICNNWEKFNSHGISFVNKDRAQEIVNACNLYINLKLKSENTEYSSDCNEGKPVFSGAGIMLNVY